MGGETIRFGRNREIVEQELKAIREQNQELRNSQKLLKQDIANSMSGVIASAQQQFNITSFNPLFQSNIASPLSINYTFLNYFYKTHGIIQTAIDQPVLDAMSSGDQTGAGVEIKSEVADEYDLQKVQGFMEDEGIWDVVAQAKIWARLFGGGALIINDGAKDYAEPLDTDGPLQVLQLYAASRWELGSAEKLSDPTAVVNEQSPWEHTASISSNYYDYYGQRLHKSRVITMNGKEAPWMVRWMLQGWGMSEVEKMVEDFNLYLRTRNVLYDLLNEAKVDVFGIDGLRETLMSPGGNEAILRRIATVQQAKNMNNALLMDKNDLYEQKQLSLAGISDIMKQNQMGIASAVRMPVSKIFGVGATGFSSGEDDLETYNAMVQSTVRNPLRKPIRQVIDLVCRRLLGAKLDQYSVHYKPLRVMSAKDEEVIKDQKFNRGLAMVDRQMMTSEQMGDFVHKENLISVTTLAQEGLAEEFPHGLGGGGTDAEKSETEKGAKDKGGTDENADDDQSNKE